GESAGRSLGAPGEVPHLRLALRGVEPGIGRRAGRNGGRRGPVRRGRACRERSRMGRSVTGCRPAHFLRAALACSLLGVTPECGAGAAVSLPKPPPPAPETGAREPEGPLVSTVLVEILLPGGRRVRAELADTPERRRVGLMFRDSIPPDGGMLLAFPED